MTKSWGPLNRYKLQMFRFPASTELPIFYNSTRRASHPNKNPPNSQEKGGWTKYAYTEVATYQYNDEGIRTVKVVNGIRHEYDVVGGQINREVIYASFYVCYINGRFFERSV